MENLYEILECSPMSTTEELRKSYISLAKRFHPDKLSASEDTGADSNQDFIKIDKAWKILKDPELRSEFDAKWQERLVSQDLPIQDTVPFEEFDFVSEEDIFVYPCRCGSDYVLSQTDVTLNFDIVCCESCSLTIRVEYKK